VTISWPELIVLMAFGAKDGDVANESVSGVVHTRDVNPLEDGVDAGEFEQVADHPTLGRVAIEESTVRVARRGSLMRVESLDHRPSLISGADTLWTFGGGDVPVAHPRGRRTFSWAGDSVMHRPSLSRWEGNDFTSLTGPITATTHLGRAAWSFELAPPSHKPYPLQMIVDAETGIVLSQANRDFGSVTEWLEIDLDTVLDPALFEWDGPARSRADWDAERDAEHQRDLAERQRWLADRGIAPLELTVHAEVMPHKWHDDGSLYASINFSMFGTLLRRPRSDEPWDDSDSVRHQHSYRWSDERWDWFLGMERPLGDDDLAALQSRLARST
jgi:hypothetical protein